MKIPARLQPLIDDGIIDYVIKPLRSGKEADLFVVSSGDDFLCAKIYKEKTKRTFHSQVLYQEGRNRRNSRSSRALGKHSKYGKKVEEQEWQDSEIDTLFTLHNAQVCVPTPNICLSGVLIMQLILDAEGEVAPQIGDITFDTEEARYCHDYLMREVIKMLLAGVVHADLSEFNVVMAFNGPIIIDFPQAVDATSNNNAQFFLERDVKNLTHFFGRFESALLEGDYGLEIWQHYKAHTLTIDMELTGKPVISEEEVDVEAVVLEIEEAREEAERKQMRRDGIEPEESNEMSEWYTEDKPKNRGKKRRGDSRGPRKKPSTNGSGASSSGASSTKPKSSSPRPSGSKHRSKSPQKGHAPKQGNKQSPRPSSSQPSRSPEPKPTVQKKSVEEPRRWGRR